VNGGLKAPGTARGGTPRSKRNTPQAAVFKGRKRREGRTPRSWGMKGKENLTSSQTERQLRRLITSDTTRKGDRSQRGTPRLELRKKEKRRE